MTVSRAWRFATAAALLLAGVGPVQADTVEAALGFQSDKLRRGFSDSNGDPVLSLDARWRADAGWLAQGGLSTLGRERRRGDAELTLGGGYGGVFDAGWAWQLTATHYRVLGSGGRLPYHELALALDAPGRVDLLLAASPDYPGQLYSGGSGRGGMQIAEVGWHPRLAPGWVLDLGIGQVRYPQLAFTGHGYGSVGLSWRSGRFGASATRVFRGGPGPAVDPRLVWALSWQL